MVVLILPIMTSDDGDERILDTTMLNGADAADDGCEGAGATGGRGIDVEVEVKANVTKMLNGAGAADDGCEGAGAAGGRGIYVEV